MGISAARVVQLKGAGPIKTLDRYGSVPFSGTLALSDSKNDRAQVAQVVANLVKQIGITTPNVAVNLPSSHVFTTVVEVDKMAPDELGKSIRYQAESFIPTPLAKSKIDWTVIGDSPKAPNKSEVLLSSVPNEFVEGRLDMLESVGLNVIAFEPDSMALVRAVVGRDVTTPQMVLDIGSASTDLVITMAGAPHLTRSIPIGWRAFVTAAMQVLNISAEQAQQFVLKFGVSKDKLEGQVYRAIIPTVDNLMNEIDKSIKFLQERYPNTKLERIIVTGHASTLPELPLYIANKFGVNVEIGNAWLNVSSPPDKQNELMAASNSFAVAAGLAERELK